MLRIGMLTSGGDCQALNLSLIHIDVYKRQILNGTKGKRMILESELEGSYEIVVKDCKGEETDRFACEGKLELFAVNIPVAGQIYLVRK